MNESSAPCAPFSDIGTGFDPRAGPDESATLGRGPTCLTAHESSNTAPLDEKKAFKILIPRPTGRKWPGNYET